MRFLATWGFCAIVIYVVGVLNTLLWGAGPHAVALTAGVASFFLALLLFHFVDVESKGG